MKPLLIWRSGEVEFSWMWGPCHGTVTRSDLRDGGDSITMNGNRFSPGSVEFYEAFGLRWKEAGLPDVRDHAVQANNRLDPLSLMLNQADLPLKAPPTDLTDSTAVRLSGPLGAVETLAFGPLPSVEYGERFEWWTRTLRGSLTLDDGYALLSCATNGKSFYARNGGLWSEAELSEAFEDLLQHEAPDPLTLTLRAQRAAEKVMEIQSFVDYPPPHWAGHSEETKRFLTAKFLTDLSGSLSA